MIDCYNRTIDYVRISVTDRCNLRCVYCMPEEGVTPVPHDAILRYDEIIKMCEVFAYLGIKKIKITGGEPLVRKNIAHLIASIKKIKGIEEVTLTTNGILLSQLGEELLTAGVDGINISVDTLDPLHYAEITRGGDIKKVLHGLLNLVKIADIPIKINCVPNDISDAEILDILELSRNEKIHTRFIEMMPVGFGKDEISKNVVYINQELRIEKLISETIGTLTPCNSKLGNGPSRYYTIDGFHGKIGFISAISHKFCGDCNRVRLTSEGFLKTCLQFDYGESVFDLLRQNAPFDELVALVEKVIQNKPMGHHFLDARFPHEECKIMSQIGG